MTFLGSITMLISAVIFSFLIWLVYRRFWVKLDPNLEKVIQMLPGLNCGACGFASCETLADSIIKSEDVICPIAGKDRIEQIYKLLGKKGFTWLNSKAIVLCNASSDDKVFYAEYSGIKTCRAANIYFSYQACTYGCLGFGDCLKVCPVSAIEIKNGLADIEINKCIGCGLCLEACPRKIIKLLPLTEKFLIYVACVNKDKADEVKAICRVGCIACGICTKIGPQAGFVLEHDLARVNYEKIKDHREGAWLKALEKCPMKTIQVKYIKEEVKV